MAGSWERVLSCECFIGTIGDGSCNMSLVNASYNFILFYGPLGFSLSSVALLLGFHFRVLGFLVMGKHVLPP